jgi:hypothetical protein
MLVNVNKLKLYKYMNKEIQSKNSLNLFIGKVKMIQTRTWIKL